MCSEWACTVKPFLSTFSRQNIFVAELHGPSDESGILVSSVPFLYFAVR